MNQQWSRILFQKASLKLSIQNNWLFKTFVLTCWTICLNSATEQTDLTCVPAFIQRRCLCLPPLQTSTSSSCHLHVMAHLHMFLMCASPLFVRPCPQHWAERCSLASPGGRDACVTMVATWHWDVVIKWRHRSGFHLQMWLAAQVCSQPPPSHDSIWSSPSSGHFGLLLRRI